MSHKLRIIERNRVRIEVNLLYRSIAIRGTSARVAARSRGRDTNMEIMRHPWVDLDALRRRTDLMIVPTGAVEVYGPHLPTGTDTIVIEHVARRVSEAL